MMVTMMMMETRSPSLSCFSSSLSFSSSSSFFYSLAVFVFSCIVAVVLLFCFYFISVLLVNLFFPVWVIRLIRGKKNFLIPENYFLENYYYKICKCFFF